MPQVVFARRAHVRCLIHGNPIDGEADVILAGNIRIHPAVVLLVHHAGRICRRIVRNIGHGTVQPASDARRRRTYPAQVMRSQRSRQRGSDIQPLSRNRDAVHSFRQADIPARLVDDAACIHARAGKGEKLRGNAARRRQPIKSGRIVPACRADGRVISLRFIREERKQLVLPKRTTQAASNLVELLRVSQQSTRIGRARFK